jgi:hypothetical protein
MASQPVHIFLSNPSLEIGAAVKWYSCCRGRRSACPEVAVESGRIYIKDDDGSIISLTAIQLYDVHATVARIVNSQQDD